MRFFLFESCVLGIETANFDPNARRLTKLEPNEIFNDFAISRVWWNRFKLFLFKRYGRTHEDFRSWSRMKVLLAISWCSNEITNLIFLSFKYVHKCQKLWNFEADRTNIAEVTPEWSFSWSCILRYEVI